MSKEFVMKMEDLNTGEDFWFYPGKTCWLADAYTALYTVIDTTDTTITFSDGTTTIGVITITASGAAEGDVDQMVLDTTSLGKVEISKTKPLKIVGGGEAASTGDAMLTMIFDDLHGGSS